MNEETEGILRISVTQVQSYLTYLSGRISLGQFVDSYLYRNPRTIKMIAGTNFHCEIQGLLYEKDERIIFDSADIEEAKQKVDSNSDIFEYKIRKQFDTPSGKVMLTGVADQVVGNMVCEFKTTYSSFSYDSYADSIQWKAYCNLFDVELIKYQVWQLSEPDELWTADNAKPLKVKSYNEFVIESNACTQNTFLQALHEAVALVKKLGIVRYSNK
jgi:hypothetical protein